MRLTTFSDYTVRVLIYLALAPRRQATIPEIASAYGISANHLMKVGQHLSRTGLVESSRGKHGGLRLMRSPESIRLGEVLRASEGEAAALACLEAQADNCRLAPACRLGGLVMHAFESFYASLDASTLVDLIDEPVRRQLLAGSGALAADRPASPPHASPPHASPPHASPPGPGGGEESDTLPAQLRRATRDLHHRVDHHPLLAPLLRRDLSEADYVEALLALHAFNAPVEARIAAYAERHHPDWDYGRRHRVADLLADLASFGCRPPAPDCEIPEIDSSAMLVGYLYVLEGSALGGQVIARQVAQSLPRTLHEGGRFFNARGEQTMALWGDFLAFAARSCPPRESAAACAAAVSLFEKLLALLDRHHAGREAAAPQKEISTSVMSSLNSALP